MTRPQARATQLIEDDAVRGTRFDFAPGAETGWHRHGHDYVITAVTDCHMLLEEPGGTKRSVTIPGVNFRIGLDAIAGLVPIAGDLLAAAMGAYLVWEARNLGMPKWKLWRMAGNLAVDTALGSIPVAGDVFDVFFRSNSRNLRILKRHLDRHHPASQVIDG